MKKLKMSISDLLQILITLKKEEKEKESASFNFVALFVNSLFPLIDNFEIALSQDNVNEEIKTLGNMLSTVLNSLQIEEIGVGEKI